MAKFFGPVGYVKPTEVKPGKWKDEVYEYDYFGDVPRQSSRWSGASDSTNDDLSVNVQISIVADPFAMHNFQWMKYIKYMGAYWKVASVEPKFPRLLITLGGVYNGQHKS